MIFDGEHLIEIIVGGVALGALFGFIGYKWATRASYSNSQIYTGLKNLQYFSAGIRNHITGDAHLCDYSDIGPDINLPVIGYPIKLTYSLEEFVLRTVDIDKSIAISIEGGDKLHKYVNLVLESGRRILEEEQERLLLRQTQLKIEKEILKERQYLEFVRGATLIRDDRSFDTTKIPRVEEASSDDEEEPADVPNISEPMSEEESESESDEKTREKIVCDCGQALSHRRYLESTRPNGKGHRATKKHLRWLDSQICIDLSRSRLEGFHTCTLHDIATSRGITNVEIMTKGDLIKEILAKNPKKISKTKRGAN